MSGREWEVNKLLWLSVLWLVLTVSDIAAMAILPAVHALVSWKFAIVHPLVVVGWIGLATAWFISRRTKAGRPDETGSKDDLTPVA